MEVLRSTQLVTAATAYLLSTSLLLLLISSGTQVTEAQKLQKYCKFTPQHTLCKTTGLGKACGPKVPARGVKKEDAAVVVAQHNQLRARVALGQETKGAPGPQPKAANMLEMAWDEELSLIAQRHTDQCIFEHECGDCRKVERFGVGQNLFMSFQKDVDPAVHWPQAIQGWYEEVELFRNSGVDSYNFESSTGHYTALMWSSTNLVGCGFTMFEEGGWFKKLYTCNYGPAGNIIFSAMYNRGEPCSSCPEGTSCSLAYPGLCASNDSLKGIGKPSAVQSLGSLNQGGNQSNQLRPGTAGRTPLSTAKAVQSDIPLPQSSLAVPTTLPPHPATVGSKTILQNLQAAGSKQSPATQVTSTRPQNQQASISPALTKVLDGGNHQSEPPPNLLRIDNIQKFLMNFGRSSQVIRTDSLDSDRAIINSLPQHTHPFVLFRSRVADGPATTTSSAGFYQVKSAPSSAGSSAPSSAAPRDVGNRRTIRSTVTPAKQTLDRLEQFKELDMEANLENMLLSCQDVTAPCPVVALAGNWTHGREFQTNVVRTVLAPSMGGQLVLGQTIPPPESGAACVTLSHKFMRPGTSDSLPQVQDSVLPLGQVLLQEDLGKVSSLQEATWF